MLFGWKHWHTIVYTNSEMRKEDYVVLELKVASINEYEN